MTSRRLRRRNIASAAGFVRVTNESRTLRSRERNLTLTGLAFVSDADGIIFNDPNTPPSTRDRLRGARVRADADLADRFRGINQFNVTFSQGIDGLGATDAINPLASRAHGRPDFSKLEFTDAHTQRMVSLGLTPH